jgi:uncharacterized membrane protein
MSISRSTLSHVAQYASVLFLGLIAGFFLTYSINVSRGLLQFDGQTYAAAQSALNRSVRHSTFFTLFFGPAILCTLSLVDGWRDRPLWWWLMALCSVGYSLGIILFTHEVNLPLNALTESWTPSTVPQHWSGVRNAWNRANDWRSGCSVVLLALSLASIAVRRDRTSQAQIQRG